MSTQLKGHLCRDTEMNEGVKEAMEILKEMQALGWSGEDRTTELRHALLVRFHDPV